MLKIYMTKQLSADSSVRTFNDLLACGYQHYPTTDRTRGKFLKNVSKHLLLSRESCCLRISKESKMVPEKVHELRNEYSRLGKSCFQEITYA